MHELTMLLMFKCFHFPAWNAKLPEAGGNERSVFGKENKFYNSKLLLHGQFGCNSGWVLQETCLLICSNQTWAKAYGPVAAEAETLWSV